MRPPAESALARATGCTAAGGAALALWGCAQSLPDPELIAEGRIVALRFEVVDALAPDPQVDPTRAEFFPLERITTLPLFADPTGAYPAASADRFDPLWIACDQLPGEGLFGCLRRAMPLDVEALPPCPLPDLNDVLAGEVVGQIGPCLVGREGAPLLTVPISGLLLSGGDLELTIIASEPGGTSTDRCARDLLAGVADVANDCILGVQRVPIGSTEQLVAALEAAGISTDALPLIVDDSIPAIDLDRNPSILEVTVHLLDDAGESIAQWQPARGGTIEAPRGAALRVDMFSADEELQTYYVSVNNGESWDPRTERFSGRWFRTWGLQQAGSSNIAEAFNVWTLERGPQDPDDRAAGERATFIYVLRDDRQGVDFWWFDAVLSTD